MAERVAGALASQPERAEIDRARRKPTESRDAYDYYPRGMANLHRGTRDCIDSASLQFCRALKLDASFASGCAMATWCHV
jgi:hypothetical protein